VKRRPKDVSKREYEHVMSLAPQGAVLKRTKRHLWWRDFYFFIEGKPSKVSKLKRGDIFVLSAPTVFEAR
jgi:hypothetical protein